MVFSAAQTGRSREAFIKMIIFLLRTRDTNKTILVFEINTFQTVSFNNNHPQISSCKQIPFPANDFFYGLLKWYSMRRDLPLASKAPQSIIIFSQLIILPKMLFYTKGLLPDYPTPILSNLVKPMPCASFSQLLSPYV